jgi:hypothetical protein
MSHCTTLTRIVTALALSATIVLAPLSAATAAGPNSLAGDRSGSDWSEPIPRSGMPTKPAHCIPWSKPTCTAYDRWSRWDSAFLDPRTRAWAIAYLVNGVGTVAGYSPATLVALTDNPAYEACDRVGFNAVRHLGAELFWLDRDIYTAKKWGEAMLKVASTVDSTALIASKVYEVVLAETASKATAKAAKKAVAKFDAQTDAASAALNAGIATVSAGTRLHTMTKLAFTLAASGC